MKKIFALSLILVFSLSACKKDSGEKVNSELSQSFNNMLNDYYEEGLVLNPVNATLLGDNRYNDQLPIDISIAHREKLTSYYSGYRAKLSQFNKSELSPVDKVSYDLLAWECDINLEDLKYPTHLFPIAQINSFPLFFGQLASGSAAQPFKTVKDYENWLKRVNSFTEWCDTAIANMKIGMKTGYVLPKSLTVKVIGQMKSLSSGPVEKHLFYQPVALIPKSFSPEETKKITSDYHAMVEKQIMPEFKKLTVFLEKEYLPNSRTTTGINNIPNGEAYYAHRVKMFTTTSMTPDEIFNLGEKEVARISAEMEKVKTEVGFKGDLKSFFAELRTKKELTPFTDPKQVLEHFEKIHETMIPNLDKLFGKKPNSKFEIRQTEAFRAASASAEYNQGSIDGSRPGIFYVPIPEVKKYNILSDEDLFLHEAIPGHHYQVSLQQEDTTLPKFRKILWYSAYGEGWALYSESLGKELGLYTDPYQYLGMLSAEMHRAIRLVVDAGMHSKNWTREQAIQYSMDHEARTEEGIIAEIERYMAMPGQALSYKIGQLKIRELRTKAEQELGSKFDIKVYHNKVLKTGCVPIQILEDRINSWIKSNK